MTASPSVETAQSHAYSACSVRVLVVCMIHEASNSAKRRLLT